MSIDNLIPFGLREADDQLVDVADVPQGRACACICSSCETPLNARQDKERAWHFAHRSRRVYGRTRIECEYSFFVSVRMMARQIIGRELELTLPELWGVVRSSMTINHLPLTRNFKVPTKQHITIANVTVEQQFSGASVDGHALGRSLDHPTVWDADRTMGSVMYNGQTTDIKGGVNEVRAVAE